MNFYAHLYENIDHTAPILSEVQRFIDTRGVRPEWTEDLSALALAGRRARGTGAGAVSRVVRHLIESGARWGTWERAAEARIFAPLEAEGCHADLESMARHYIIRDKNGYGAYLDDCDLHRVIGNTRAPRRQCGA